jgi:hypothetical protein
MFIFGHIGIGLKLAQPWSRGLSLRTLAIGTLLPDLIDKPLFYGTRALGIQPEWLVGTRTLGHTGIFLLLLLGTSWIRRSRTGAALSLGMATHFVLDALSDRLHHSADLSALQALLFPFRGFFFSPIPYSVATEHAHSLLNPVTLTAEAIGLFALGWELWIRFKFSGRGSGGYRTRRPG